MWRSDTVHYSITSNSLRILITLLLIITLKLLGFLDQVRRGETKREEKRREEKRREEKRREEKRREEKRR
jgi:hypothetical protein